MSKFAQEVWSNYLEAHYPVTSRPTIAYAGPQDIAELFYEMGQAFGVGAEGGHPRTERGVRELDQALLDTAEDGDFFALIEMSPEGRNELAERASWIITASMVEAASRGPFRIPVPRDAPDEIKQMAIVLYALADAGETIPDGWPPQRASEPAKAARKPSPSVAENRARQAGKTIGRGLVRALLGRLK